MMLVDLTGFAGDCLIHGRLDLRAERLTDQLNADARLDLVDVVLEGLHDGQRVAVPSFTIERADLCAVRADGPRGARRLRDATTPHRLQAQIGPYTVLGRLHSKPGIEPMWGIGDREAMVPFTGATIAYVVAGILEVRDVSTLIINRELASWLRDAETSAPDGCPGAVRIAGPNG
jgi:hypothetical protein